MSQTFMLNFSATIKLGRTLGQSAAVALVFLFPAAAAQASEKTPAVLIQQSSPADEKYAFLASARLVSPDRKTELSASEVKINLQGISSAVLKGRGINVRLESEPNDFRKSQMVKISATGGSKGGGSTELQGGMFRLNPREDHSFLFSDKAKGWVLEVRLRPVQSPGDFQKSGSGKQKAPVRVMPRKPKRLPA